MVSAWINNISDAEKQLSLFEKKIVGKDGFIEKTVNTLLDLRDKARTLADEGNIDAVHETYLEMSSLWRMLFVVTMINCFCSGMIVGHALGKK